jgi:hypothetical protein
MHRRSNNDKPALVMLGGRRITALHIARMYQKLTGRVPTADQVAAAQRALDSRYAELDGEMAESKKEKSAKVLDYRKAESPMPSSIKTPSHEEMLASIKKIKEANKAKGVPDVDYGKLAAAALNRHKPCPPAPPPAKKPEKKDK